MAEEERVQELLGYKFNMELHQTSHEQRFYRLLLEARELKEAHRRTRSTIHRQHIFMVGRIAYIADFYIPNYKLVIEIDGMQHKGQRKYDERRTKHLNSQGVKVVRFWNYELDEPNIITMIVDALKNKAR